MTKNNAVTLCPELTALLEQELALGNVLKDGPDKTDWPDKGSVFAALKFALRSVPGELPPPIWHSICRDPHYGWNDECYCGLHHDLLVAGATQ